MQFSFTFISTHLFPISKFFNLIFNKLIKDKAQFPTSVLNTCLGNFQNVMIYTQFQRNFLKVFIPLF